MKTYTITLILFFFHVNLLAQKIEIPWQNPSFEGKAILETVPKGWESHSFEGHNPPDTQPCNCGGVYKESLDGKTYLGMLIREDNTWEAVGQLLPIELTAGQAYTFNLNACRAPRYLQFYGQNQGITNFRRPAIIRVWGGSYSAPFKHLLAQTEAVINKEWMTYKLTFEAPDSITYISLESYFPIGVQEAYNGNVLIDHLSPLQPISDSTLVAIRTALRQEGVVFDAPNEPYYTYAKPVNRPNNSRAYPGGVKQNKQTDQERLNRRELIIQAQKEMALAKAPSKKELLQYEEPTVIGYSKNKQAKVLREIPSDAEAIFVPRKIRQPIVSKGKKVLSYTYQADTSIMAELAQLIDDTPDYTLIIAVVAPQQGVRDKISWSLNAVCQQLSIEDNIIQIEQYIGQNTYFKDWLWQVEDNRVMMRVIERE